MNREQAKIIGQMSDEQLEAVQAAIKPWSSELDLVCQKEQIIAFGDGKKIEYQPIGTDSWVECTEPVFSRHIVHRIATPKITFNGVEIDAPIKDYESAPTKIWALVQTDQGLKVRKFLKDPSHTQILIACGLVWADREACQLYLETHNKMMGG